MSVPRQLTQIAFAAPLDESTEDEILDPTIGFPVLQNVRQDRRGGLSKRLGYDARSSVRTDGTTRTSGRKLFSHKGSACVVTGDSLDVYVPSGATSIKAAGQLPRCTVQTFPIPLTTKWAGGVTYDAVVCNGFLATLCVNVDGNLEAVVTTADESTMLVLPIKELNSGATFADFQVGAYGTTVLALICLPGFSSNSVALWKLDCTSATTIAVGWVLVSAAVRTDIVGIDAKMTLWSLSDRVALAYKNALGNMITVATFNAAGLVEYTTIATSATPDNLAIEGSAGTLWVAWNESIVTNVIGLNPTALSTVLMATGTVAGMFPFVYSLDPLLRPSIVSTGPGSAAMIWSQATGRTLYQTWTTVAGTFSATSDLVDQRGATVGGPAWLSEGHFYALFQVDNTTETTSVALAEWTPDGNAHPFPPHAYAFPDRAVVSYGAHLLTLSDGRRAHVVAVETAADVYTLYVIAYDFADQNAWRTASHNGETCLSGGLLSSLSGGRVSECSFLHPPQVLTGTGTGSGTGPAAAGVYTWVAVFQDVDGAGNLSISGVSNPIQGSGNGHAVTLSCDPIRLTSRDRPRVSFYRTQSNGKTFFLVGSVGANISIAPGASLTLSDTLTDSALASQPLLYGTGLLPGTGGAPLQHEAPPYCVDVVSFSGMLVVASGSDLWWSGQTISGEGAWFSAEQFFVTVEGDGDIVALAVQDGTLYVFKEKAIWVVSGEVPADNGTAGGLGTPRRIAGDVGCTEPASIVVTSLGIFFRSHRGIELLGRGGGAVWVGEKVQRTLAAYPYVTSASLDMYNNLIRFSLASSIASGVVSGEGRDIVFDPVINDWQSVDDKRGTSAHQASQDACTINVGGEQRYAWLAADGTLCVEGDTYLDNGTWISMVAETGWFKLAGIQGRQQLNRILSLSRKRTDADISIAIGYNYGTSLATPQVWTSDVITTVLDTKGWPITQLQHDPNNDAEGMAIKVRIVDATPSGAGAIVGTGRGATWLALTLDITPKDGPAEVAPEAA